MMIMLNDTKTTRKEALDASLLQIRKQLQPLKMALKHLQARRQVSGLDRMEALKREVERHSEMLIETIEGASEVRHKRGETIMDRIEAKVNLNQYYNLLYYTLTRVILILALIRLDVLSLL